MDANNIVRIPGSTVNMDSLSHSDPMWLVVPTKGSMLFSVVSVDGVHEMFGADQYLLMGQLCCHAKWRSTWRQPPPGKACRLQCELGAANAGWAVGRNSEILLLGTVIRGLSTPEAWHLSSFFFMGSYANQCFAKELAWEIVAFIFEATVCPL